MQHDAEAPRAGQPSLTATAVVYEDRPACVTGAKIAVASLRLHCPDLEVLLWSPGHTDELSRWAEDRGIELRGDRPDLQGWNVKPGILLDLLDRHETVYWLDSDVLVTGDVRSRAAVRPRRPRGDRGHVVGADTGVLCTSRRMGYVGWA